MKFRTTMTLASVTILLVAGAALAQGGFGKGGFGRGECDGEGPGRGARLERLAERLDLTDEQKTAIEAIHEETRTKNEALAKETRLVRHELEGELLKDEPSEKKVLELNARLGDLRAERQANGLKARLAVRKQLTPEQRDKMLALGERFGEGRRGEFRRGRGHGRGFGGCDGHGPGGCDGSGCGGRGGRGSR